MRDENGPNDKLLSIPVGEPRFDRIDDLEVLPQHRLVEIEHFFATYKQLEGKTSVVTGWSGREAALVVLQQSQGPALLPSA